MKSIFSSVVAVVSCSAVASAALATGGKTQTVDQRDICSAHQGQMVVTRTAQWKKQGYAKSHTFEVACEAYISRKESLKSWYVIDANQQGNAQIKWEPDQAKPGAQYLRVKCRTNDPLIMGISDYNYQDVQVPTESMEFERVYELRDGGPAKFSALPALAQQTIALNGVDQQLDFITLQGNAVGKDKFYLEFVAYPKVLPLDSQAPHYTSSVSPRMTAVIPLDAVALKQGCADLVPLVSQGSWQSDGTVQDGATPVP